MQGVISGSFIVFSLQFLFSLFLGRLFCGWECPGGGLQEACFAVNDAPGKGRKIDLVKYVIRADWLTAIAVMRGGYDRVDFFHNTM